MQVAHFLLAHAACSCHLCQLNPRLITPPSFLSHSCENDGHSCSQVHSFHLLLCWVHVTAAYQPWQRGPLLSTSKGKRSSCQLYSVQMSLNSITFGNGVSATILTHLTPFFVDCRCIMMISQCGASLERWRRL